LEFAVHDSVNLNKEVAVVTGGSRNIGLAIATTLRAAGAHVCIWGAADVTALDKALSALKGDASTRMGLLVKVEDEDAVVGAFDQVESKLGPVSILVNNAAARPHAPLTTMSRAEWTSVLDVILTGAFLTSRELFRRLPHERMGAIVNIGGLSAHRPAKDRAHVIAAKAGLIGLTRALAEEGLGRIRANCVVPGAIETERRPGQRGPRFLDDAGHAAGHPEDVARSVLSLADPKDQYVTGQTLHVSGGRFMP
jgi:3-oxoacyl-[acyl-carrier protein] reductase